MKQSYFLALTVSLLLSTGLSAQQVSFQAHHPAPVPKGATVDFRNLGPDYAPSIQYLEAPSPSGEGYRTFLQEQKEEVGRRFPRTGVVAAEERVLADPPILLLDFAGNNSTSGTPMDNHLAVSRDRQVVSVINSHLAVKSPDANPPGYWVGAATLENFTSDLGIGQFKFDPRVLYDPVADRFVVFALAGNTSLTNSIIIAFSETNDADGEWHLYNLTGPEFSDYNVTNNVWSDYPIVAMTDTEIILTINSVFNNQPWQTGFFETVIWQINKEEGYSGQPLELTYYTGIEFGGKRIRNLCPVKHATGEPGDNVFFLSNRNFDVENDSIFIVELTGKQGDPNTTIEVDVRKADQAYGVPPNAIQTNGTLATNDARVLDAFLLDDQIQFVGNTVDFNTGQAAIYHGLIDNLSTTRDITGYIVNGGADDLGYPSIAYTGLEAGDEDAIIVASHSSATRFPGCSALYFDNDRNHSELVTIKEGLNYIGNIPNTEDERWGDYSGNQRKYDEPGTVWAVSSFGESNTDNDTWIGQLARPDLNVATAEVEEEQLSLLAFPNPARELVTVEFDAGQAERVRILVTDLTGKPLASFMDDKPKKPGKAVFSFSTDPLATGVYFVTVLADEKVIASQKVVVQKD